MRLRNLVILAVLGALAAAAFIASYFFQPQPRPAAGIRTMGVEEFCAACHKAPDPQILPRSSWKGKIELMYSLVGASKDPVPQGLPPIREAIDFYTARAPESLAPLPPSAGGGPGPLRLRPIPIRLHDTAPFPGTANVRFAHLFDDRRFDLLVSEMRFGMVLAFKPYDAPGQGAGEIRRLGSVPHPCHAEVVDLDRDGRRDVLAADLGTVTPSDARDGAVAWLRGMPDGGFQPVTLAAQLGRVADAQAADFDGDGDEDVIAAVFGWRAVGEILYLENRTVDWSAPRFEQRVIDHRPGAIAVPCADLDGDGRPDFVGLISQHHERVVAYLNRGRGDFEPREIYAAPHPNWGFSGMELVDLDGDRDLDVLTANGDTLDDFILKPYHGVAWLENRGEYPFVHHRLADLYGAHRARAADLDGDGDLDIAVSVFLPFLEAGGPGVDRIDTLIWLEQTGPGVFARHTIEAGHCVHPTLDAADYDADGWTDIVAGNMTMAQGGDALENWLVIYRNLGR